MGPKSPLLAAAVLLASCAARSVIASPPAAGPPPFDPALGAIKAAGSWKQTTFILLTEEGGVVDVPALTRLPYGSDSNSPVPATYEPKGFWKELRPGRYRLLAAASGKRLGQVTIDVKAGEETWARAELGEARSEIVLSEPLDEKTGPEWSKNQALKLRWRQP